MHLHTSPHTTPHHTTPHHTTPHIPIPICIALLGMARAQIEESPQCPCLSAADMQAAALLNESHTTGYSLGIETMGTSFGVGCMAHDLNVSDECISVEDPQCATLFPTPSHCKGPAPNWCLSRWCYVAASNCQLSSKVSGDFDMGSYSYATCGSRDEYSMVMGTERLRGRTLRVGFRKNTGGWKGRTTR